VQIIHFAFIALHKKVYLDSIIEKQRHIVIRYESCFCIKAQMLIRGFQARKVGFPGCLAKRRIPQCKHQLYPNERKSIGYRPTQPACNINIMLQLVPQHKYIRQYTNCGYYPTPELPSMKSKHIRIVHQLREQFVLNYY